MYYNYSQQDLNLLCLIHNTNKFLSTLKTEISLLAILREDESPAVIFLPVNSSREKMTGTLSQREAAEVVQNFLMRRVDASLLQESYPTNIGEFSSSTNAFDAAMQSLQKSSTVVQPAAGIPPASDKTEGKTPGAAPKVPKKVDTPKADEVW